MDFETLKKLLDGNEDGLKVVGSIEANFTKLKDDFNSLERKANEAIQTRDKTKESLRLVKDKLGVDEINSETLETVLKTKGDDKTLAELENYKKQLGEFEISKKEMESDYQNKIKNLVLDNAIKSSSLVDVAIDNPIARQTLIEIAKKGATIDENNNIVYKKEDGTTDIGRTLETVINDIKVNEQYAPFVKADVKGGTSTAPQSGSRGNVSGKSFKERQQEHLKNK